MKNCNDSDDHMNNVKEMAESVRQGKLDRREFLALASTLGASATLAYGLIGLSNPVLAQSAEATKGGTLKVAMNVKWIGDPRTYDWTEMGNLSRQFLEPLVRWNTDFTFSGVLLLDWDVSEDALTYTLRLRQDALWNNGDKFVADDVVFNFERWCDKSAEGNAMAIRMASLIDPDTGAARDGAIEKVDDHTVRLNLSHPDITLIASMSDYPALIVHRNFDPEAGLAKNPVGTGPFELVSLDVGEKAMVSRRDGGWWGGEPFLDAIEFLDYGTDPAAVSAAFEAGEVHINDLTSPDFAPVLDGLGLSSKNALTAATMVARMRSDSAPYDNVVVRKAIQKAVNNEVVLELGYGGQGLVAENHHVGPMHPEYAKLPIVKNDAAEANRMMAEAGHLGTEIELISVAGDWRSTASDAIAAMLRDAGLNIKRTQIPGSTFWNGWKDYPFSTTDWGPRPLGVQVLALAYMSDSFWNESAHKNPEFDKLLQEAMGVFDAEKRAAMMGDIQRLLQDSGAIIQPFWTNNTKHHTPDVQGIEMHQAREMNFENVWIEA
jgi:peptide/nickel transport system substrate-binding protein